LNVLIDRLGLDRGWRALGSDFERYHGDQPLLCVEAERSRGAVDLDGAQRYAGNAGVGRTWLSSVRVTQVRVVPLGHFSHGGAVAVELAGYRRC
jgi:hypothetical protein